MIRFSKIVSEQAMEESQKQLEEMKKALSDNDTHIQLSNLERRWQVRNKQTHKR